MVAQFPRAVFPLDVGILPVLDDLISHARSLESGASPPDGDPVEKMPRLDDLLKLKASLVAASKEKATTRLTASGTATTEGDDFAQLQARLEAVEAEAAGLWQRLVAAAEAVVLQSRARAV